MTGKLQSSNYAGLSTTPDLRQLRRKAVGKLRNGAASAEQVDSGIIEK